jgi:hypothetical protein
VGFHNTLFDFHGFRQTQTAIAAEGLLAGDNFFHYKIPVLGPPWEIPFEFPLYQGLVALLARLFSAPLDQTGRFVSILFYYLCFFPLASILSHLNFRGVQRIPVLALFAVSPLYIFVSRLFLIESMALFLSLMYLDQVFRMVQSEERWQYRYIAGAAVFGVLSALVKVTTFAPFFVLGTFLSGWQFFKEHNNGFKIKRAIPVSVFCVVLPIVFAKGWMMFGDQIKKQNPFTVNLMSNTQGEWTYGTLSQRINPRVYIGLLRAGNYHIGSILVGILVLAVYIWLCRRWNWIAAICVVLYIGTIETFFNLHVVHEYYPYSIAIFLVVAVGVLITSILKIPDSKAWIGVALLILQVGACGHRYFIRYYPIQSINHPGWPAASAFIDRTTRPQDVIVIVGENWSPEFPYQSHRRAIMNVLNLQIKNWDLVTVEQVVRNTGVQNIAAVVACSDGRSEPGIATLNRDIGMSQTAVFRANDCDIYERNASSTAGQ